MLFGNRGPRSSAAGRREGYRPKLQSLEERLLLAIDLGGALPPNQPNIATQPFGVDLAGSLPAGAAGFSVSDVGDVNGDGFDDFVVGAPTGININGIVQPGAGNNSRAYLVFGSRSVTAANIDWLTLNNLGQRVGDLGQLGAAAQTNPISGAAGFAYAGVTFQTSLNTASQLGASVTALGDVNGDGFADFLMGAPGANALTGLNPGTGRAYLVYGSAALNTLTTPTIDLDTPATAGGVTILTMGSTVINSRVGSSVARVGNFFATGATAPEIAIGAPNASVAGLTDNGAVYVLPGSLIAAPTTGPLNLASIGNGAGGVTFAGSAAGEEIGTSIAGAGNVNGVLTQSNVGIDDFLIGASNANGRAGEAFLVYGGNTIPGAGANVGGLNVILTNRIGAAGTGALVGALFQGASGARTGFAVSSVGDYNADGFADFAIGSPFASNNTGQADIFYGQPASGTSLVGTIPVFNKPAGVPALTLLGALQGSLAGYSLSISGKVNTAETGNDFIVGSPGLNGNQGGAYYIPSNPFLLTGTQQLTNAESQPLAATLIQLTNAPVSPAFFGASVSGRLVAPAQTKTADNDNKADFIIGAPNYSVTTSGRTAAGGAFVVEGNFLPVQTPVSNAIPVVIGVGQEPPGPFIVSATAPPALDIFIRSNNTVSPPFFPLRDINLTTILVNGVPFPTATIRQDPNGVNGDVNNDGIPDAIITITPRSRLNLLSTTTTLTIRGQAPATSPNAGNSFLGTAAIIVSGGNVPVVPGSVSGTIQVGTILPTSFVPQFGADHFVPPAAVLSRLNYKAIPRAVAYQQYVPGRGWATRLHNFAHPEQLSRVPAGKQRSLAGTLPLTLDHSVFTRSKFKDHKPIEFHHEVPVIPTNRQTERFLAKGVKHPKFR